MCGIIYAKRGGMVNKMILKRYEKQKSRGKQGYGFIEMKGGYVIGEQRAQEEKEILEKLKNSEADEILFHHRFPTSTENVVEATHPIIVDNPQLQYIYYVVHNGVIWNDDKLREDHLEEGFEYTTEITEQWVTKKTIYSCKTKWNDSEGLAIEVAKAIERGDEIEARGSIAMITLQVERGTNKAVALYYGRNHQNPLCVEMQKEFFAISSESGESIKTDMMYRLDYETGKISEQEKKIGPYSYQAPAANNYKSDGTGTSVVKYKAGFETTEAWQKDFGLPPRNAPITYYPEEEDFILDIKDDIERTQAKIKDAEKARDFDRQFELELELEELQIEMQAIKIQEQLNDQW